ncbi:hypothetical protein ACROYT_G038224 [Oculina patagonica]
MVAKSAKWREFAANTTVHGLRYVYESPSRIVRILWLFLLLASVACYIYFAQQSFAKYFSNPVNTEFAEIIPELGKLTFPAVTICNLNRFVKRKINMADTEEDFQKLGLNLSACEAIKKVNKDMTCGQGLLCAFEMFGSVIAENCNETTRQQIISVLNSTKEPIFNPEEFFEAYGHEFDEMFLYYCRFGAVNVENCTPADFYPLISQNGRCFTFNSGKNGTKIRSARRAGSVGGFSIIMDVQANENTISEFSRGLRVIVHDQGTFINMLNGFNVFPGSHTLVQITATKRQRLSSPYKSNCTQQVLPRIPRYTRDGCFTQCQANITLAMCGCKMIGVPVSSNMPVCTFQHRSCEEQMAASFNPNDCSCALPCVEMDYTTQVSYSQFPDDGAGKILNYVHNYHNSIQYQRENLVFLQVGFRFQGFTLITETPSYKMDSLLGDIGGNMGLFLGCSLLTLFEFLNLLWNVLKSQEYNVANEIGVQEQRNEQQTQAGIV